MAGERSPSGAASPHFKKNTGHPGFPAPESRDTRDSGLNRPSEPNLPGIPRHWKSADADRPGIFNNPAPIGALGALACDCERHCCPGLIPSAPPQDSRSASPPLILFHSDVPTHVSTRTHDTGCRRRMPASALLRGGGCATRSAGLCALARARPCCGRCRWRHGGPTPAL